MKKHKDKYTFIISARGTAKNKAMKKYLKEKDMKKSKWFPGGSPDLEKRKKGE